MWIKTGSASVAPSSCICLFYSLFIFRTNIITIYLLIYVDDINVTSSSTLAVDRLVHYLSTEITIKDISTLHYFLDIEAGDLADAV